MKELYEDYIKMQAELPSVLKSKQGQAGQGKFKYADLTEIVDTIRPILAKFGFAFMQPIFTIDGKTYLQTNLIHKSGQNLASNVLIEFQGENIKTFGASITYYRRYSLQSVLGIVADDDADDIDDPVTKPEINPTAKLKLFANTFAPDLDFPTVEKFLNARATYNGRTINQNIDDFKGKEEAFWKEINGWLVKQPK